MTDDITPSETPPAPAAVPSGDPSSITEDMVKLALRRVKDPELNLNIIDLGLVYDIRVDGTTVGVDMSLTSPACPSGPEIMGDADSSRCRPSRGHGRTDLPRLVAAVDAGPHRAAGADLPGVLGDWRHGERSRERRRVRERSPPSTLPFYGDSSPAGFLSVGDSFFAALNPESAAMN